MVQNTKPQVKMNLWFCCNLNMCHGDGGITMLSLNQKSKIIDFKRNGKSTREIARLLKIDRKTISKYWNEAQQTLDMLKQKGADTRSIQHEIYLSPSYKERACKKRKVTDEMLARLTELVTQDNTKTRAIRWGKQRLTNVQIHQIIIEEGWDISLATINNELAKIRNPHRMPDVYIRQAYEYGKRLEFDYGNVKLDLGSGLKNYSLAVFCAPASNFRWCFLYDSEKQDAFLDSHVKFFNLIGGVWSEVWYDNMKNVVASFGSKHEKKLNTELVKLASYYGYEIRTTNPYSGNEKGSVERSVEVLRNRLFSLNQRFESLETARKYVDTELKKINKGSELLFEKEYLQPAPPPY